MDTIIFHVLFPHVFIPSLFQASSSKNWTEWSACSRSCDGGISSRQKCSNQGSPGDCVPLSQHKICNMHPCENIPQGGPKGRRNPSFRDEQCAQHHDVRHEVRHQKGQCYQLYLIHFERFGSYLAMKYPAKLVTLKKGKTAKKRPIYLMMTS